MTHTPTREPLDSFESALLTELHREAAERPVTSPAPVRRRRRVLAVAATGIAASVAAVIGLVGTGSSPAYAVQLTADGDVVVTVHRLDDATGLEEALRAKGVDADVNYDPDENGPNLVSVGPDGEVTFSDEGPPPVPESTVPDEAGAASGGQDSEGDVVTSGPPADDQCGLDARQAELTQEGDDWVLRIPAGSPLMDRPVTIGTDAGGGLSVFYGGDQPGSFCGVMQMRDVPTD